VEVDQQPAWDNTYTVPVVITENLCEMGRVISVPQW